jgi:S1-C subfamily serine protease
LRLMWGFKMRRAQILAVATLLVSSLLPAQAAPADDLGMKVKAVRDGLEVMGVTPKGLADQLGLARGNVIRSVNRKDVRTQDALEEALISKRERILLIQVSRSGKQETIRAEVFWPPMRPAEAPRPPIVIKKTVQPAP